MFQVVYLRHALNFRVPDRDAYPQFKYNNNCRDPPCHRVVKNCGNEGSGRVGPTSLSSKKSPKIVLFKMTDY